MYKRQGQKGSLPNGILYLKGGDLAEELALTGKRWHVYDIPRFFGEEFFETKKVVYTPVSYTHLLQPVLFAALPRLQV